MNKNNEKNNRVTFEEISDEFSNFEVAFLSFCKAVDIIRSARSLITASYYKPKVAMVAFNEICSSKEDTKRYKLELKSKFFEAEKEIAAHEASTEDSYKID